MASDIAVGIAVLAAAKKEDRLRREEQAREREEARRQPELVLRSRHVEERRGAALDQILAELPPRARPRGRVTGLRQEDGRAAPGRPRDLLAFPTPPPPTPHAPLSPQTEQT